MSMKKCEMIQPRALTLVIWRREEIRKETVNNFSYIFALFYLLNLQIKNI